MNPDSRRSPRSRLPLLPLVAPLALTLSALGQGGPPPAQVYVDRAQMMEVETRRETTGDLRPVRRAVVASREEGRVAAFDLREGQRVEGGDVLARLDDDLLRYEVDRASAQVASDEGRIEERRAELENARRDLERLEDLSDRGSARPVELDDARTQTARIAAQLAQAEADLAVARAELARADRRLRDLTIRAPFDGRVVSTMTELGEWISSGGPVAELIAVDELEVWLPVSQTGLELIPAGDATTMGRVGPPGAGGAGPPPRAPPPMPPRCSPGSAASPSMRRRCERTSTPARRPTPTGR